ncbi:alpha/beta fold hydrolase [Amycolatopsis sp. NPDC051372]|uniref:alpha/beta fold hydrolase n=1 Tax=unclassified Amycolatopsis TaxID=2618356 RepID=UPI003419B7FA
MLVPPGAPHAFANPGDEPAVVPTRSPRTVRSVLPRPARVRHAGGTAGDRRRDRRDHGAVPARTRDHLRRRRPRPPSETREVRLCDGTVRVEDRGTGCPVLPLHGGAGPASVSGLTTALAGRGARVLAPVLPGFDETPPVDGVHDVPALAHLFRQLPAKLDLEDVLVVGNSLGGWIAVQMGVDEQVAGTQRVVLLNVVGTPSTGSRSPTSRRSRPRTARSARIGAPAGGRRLG